MRERGLGPVTGAGWGELGLCTAKRGYKAVALGLVTGIKETGKINASSNRRKWRARYG